MRDVITKDSVQCKFCGRWIPAGAHSRKFCPPPKDGSPSCHDLYWNEYRREERRLVREAEKIPTLYKNRETGAVWKVAPEQEFITLKRGAFVQTLTAEDLAKDWEPTGN